MAQNISDAALLNTYALQNAFSRLLKLGVMPKNTDNSVQPNTQLTRAKAIMMLNEFDGQLLSAGPDLRFDWQMEASTFTASNILVTKVGGGTVPSYTITPITPLKFKISFNGTLVSNSNYVVNVTTGVKDSLDNSLATSHQVTFNTDN
ncbi:Ig-like domain-containing protein [Paenibacillus sp. HWE-109]|uniref:Ig-like domain-containing protein n=1 Tax=Paenibacillus sp. HWE-109 TaxID=1306526 RepID=UPI001EDF7409|nr:Ig-like domain-containing protein [Paenibacillus sp. HWE-109]UKS24133.1 Ig-like domain-containing protein [Paenibacillus sp. HWE-109]